MINNDIAPKMRLSRRGLLGVGTAAAAGVVAGCTGGKGLPGTDTSGDAGSGTGTIQWWTNHTEEDTKLFKERIEAFNKAHPDITVKLLNIAEGEQYYTKINTAAVAGKLADVFYTRSFDIAPFVARDWLLPLKDLIGKDRGEVRPDDFWPAEVAQLTVDDSLYALPYDFSNFAIYVNKTLLDKQGISMPTDDWTWDDLFEMGKPFVKRKGARQIRWGVGLTTTDWFAMGVFDAHGGETFSKDLTSCVVDNAANLGVVTGWAEQMKAGVVPATGSTPEGVDIFASQLVPFNVNGSWATLQTRAAVADKFEWDVVRLPKGPSGKRSVSAAGGAWSIAKASKNQAAAWTFLKFITSEESTDKLIADVTRSIPGRQSSAKRWEQVVSTGKLPPSSAEIFPQQMADDAVNWSYPKFWSEFEQAWNTQFDTLGVRGKPATILTKIQDDTNVAAKRY
ncbi:ABC transporter substrate-binding protein [Microlunatus soli]|uniref:ABC-type glycerol-3-phosphate transport system, substrate-binding protein n=1 Tax=Microlunatus soli TaxID=630515 RepID=A0A1H1RPE2_9ACTN|nr:sugar ABC transporter substrate-binding protein [Microlunatus soli]SDS36859.1 ABC-type glycerol-3-phosphate transport system, substrate-binding protein [Microlunatus soli]